MKSSRSGHTSRPQSNVNDKLHTLRGEQFRHLRNRNQARPDLASTSSQSRSFTSVTGTLPVDCTLIIPPPSSTYFTVDDHDREASLDTSRPRLHVHLTPEWRANALRLVSNHSPNTIPTLSMFCLRALRALPAPEFTDLIPFLPRHLCCQLMHDSAIHSPLHDPYLYSLLGSVGHANGEIIVVGPQSSMRDEHFIRLTGGTDAVDDWDSPGHNTSLEPLTMVALISVRLSVSTMLSLPPTLTHLALVHLSSSIPVHRLPPLCPLITVLDLSYNEWLGYQPPESDTPRNSDGIQMLERVDWGRWQRLAVLGLRDCLKSDDVAVRVNKGRWDDVQIMW